MGKAGGAIRGKLQGLKRFRLKTWQLLVVLLPLLFIDATLMRVDHVRMTELRDAVLLADENEDDEKIKQTMAELREFVSSNMVINIVDENGTQKIMFGTGPFYLEHQYIRAANKALAEAEAKLADDSNPNGNIYALAAETCKALAVKNGWTWNNPNYINCMTTEIQKYPAADELQDQVKASLPSTELYRHNYASPIWAPTLTGIMILITLVIVVIIIFRFIVWIVLRIAVMFI